MNYIEFPACAVAHRYYHYSSLPFGGPTFSISYISHIFSLSKGFLGLRLHAMHNDPVMTGPELNRLRHFSHYRRSFCLRGKAAMEARPPSCVISIYQHRCPSMAERPPLAPTPTSSPPSREPSNSCYPGSARRDESISDSDPKRSPYLLVLRRSPWKDLPHPSLLKRARAPISKGSFGLLAKFTEILAGWVPTSVPHSWRRSPRSHPSPDLLA